MLPKRKALAEKKNTDCDLDLKRCVNLKERLEVQNPLHDHKDEEREVEQNQSKYV